MEQIGVRETCQFLGMTFNINTIEMTWVTMVVLIVLGFVATRNMKLVPTGWQNVMEMAVSFIHDQMDVAMGPKARFLAPLFFGEFIFLLTANWLGLIPGFHSPTNDLNTTLGMALFFIVLMHLLGLYRKGMSYIVHFFKPTPIFVIFNLIEEFAKPITLSFRLFGNILAGEILIDILLILIPIWMPIPSVVWLAFSIFIGGVQAFIFTMLTMAYLAVAFGDDHE